MKKELKMTKKTAFILILILVSSVVLGFGIKDRLSRQGGADNYVAPTLVSESASVWDVFDEESATSNESGEHEPLVQEEPVIELAGNRSEPAMLDSDLIWFDDQYASCYDLTTDLWLVYTANFGKDIFGDRAVYCYDATDSRWELFASKSPDEVWMIKGQIIMSGDMLYLWKQNNTTWVEHSKEGSTLKIGSGSVWFNDDGADCYDGLHTISSSISVDGSCFSCAVAGGIPPINYDWRSDDGQIGDASSFEPKLSTGNHSITLVVTDASGRSAEDTAEVTIT